MSWIFPNDIAHNGDDDVENNDDNHDDDDDDDDDDNDNDIGEESLRQHLVVGAARAFQLPSLPN